MRKFTVLSTFFIATPLIILISLIYLSYLSYHRSGATVLGESTENVAYAALPPNENVIETSLQEEESQVEIVRQFFARYNSPLEPYAADVVASAERHGLDFRLIPAIAMQESNLCKRIPVNSFNCWGFGIYGTKVTRFNNYPEAIETVTKTLATKYKRDRGLVTPFEIMRMYTPSSDGSWARSVTFFMGQMQ